MRGFYLLIRSNVPLRKDTDDAGENEEKSPDVIPSNNGKSSFKM